MNVNKNYQDQDVEEPTSVEVAKIKAKNYDIESRKQITNEEEGCFKQRLLKWWPAIVISVSFIIAIVIVICCVVLRPSQGSIDDGSITNDNDATVKIIRATTIYGYRFPKTDFDKCCGDEGKKRTYLEACKHEFIEDDIDCVEVIRGSTIIITKSENPNHKEIICEKFPKMKFLNNFSTRDGHYMSENEVNKQKAENKKNEKDKQIIEPALSLPTVLPNENTGKIVFLDDLKEKQEQEIVAFEKKKNEKINELKEEQKHTIFDLENEGTEKEVDLVKKYKTLMTNLQYQYANQKIDLENKKNNGIKKLKEKKS